MSMKVQINDHFVRIFGTKVCAAPASPAARVGRSLYAEGRKANRGFTLIELMVTITILGLLLTFAVPSYERLIQGARREDARHLLMLNALRLQRCFTLAGTYDDSDDQTCYLRTASEEGYYRLETERHATTYSLSAIPVTGGSQVRDIDCGTLTYDQTGAQDASGTLGEACW